MPDLAKILTTAVELAANAWTANAELRWLYGRPASGAVPLIGNGDVATLLRTMNRRKQILCFTPPTPGDRMLAHAVLSSPDYYDTPGRTFAPRETVLVSPLFFSERIKGAACFSQASAAEIGRIDADQMRALILLHEARHLYSLHGHGADPATHDPTWNDYILWTGFLGYKVRRQVG